MNTFFESFLQGWTAWGQTLLLMSATGIVWMLSRLQSIGEIRKLQMELASARVSQFEKVILLDEKLRLVTDKLYTQLYALLQAAQNADATAAKTAREAVQKVFMLEYLGAYFHYQSLGRWIFTEVRHELVEDEIIPFLETSLMVLEGVNQEYIMNLTQQEPVRIREMDINFAFRFAWKHTRFWEVQRKRKLLELKKNLLAW